MDSETGINSYVMILLAGGLATYIWRHLGVVYASRLEVGSAALDWVRAVATALIAALIVRMAVVPPGDLANAALASRLCALVAGVVGYYLIRRSIAGGVGAAVVMFLVMEAVIGAL